MTKYSQITNMKKNIVHTFIGLVFWRRRAVSNGLSIFVSFHLLFPFEKVFQLFKKIKWGDLRLQKLTDQ